MDDLVHLRNSNHESPKTRRGIIERVRALPKRLLGILDRMYEQRYRLIASNQTLREEHACGYVSDRWFDPVWPWRSVWRYVLFYSVEEARALRREKKAPLRYPS